MSELYLSIKVLFSFWIMFFFASINSLNIKFSFKFNTPRSILDRIIFYNCDKIIFTN